MCYSRTYGSWYFGLVVFLCVCMLLVFVIDCVLTSVYWVGYVRKRAMVHPTSDPDTGDEGESLN